MLSRHHLARPLVLMTFLALFGFISAACLPSNLEVMAAIHDPRLICIRHHEDDNVPADGPLYLAGRAGDPNQAGSSARGPYQVMRGTWPSMARLVGFGEWSSTPVPSVPLSVQHVVVYRYVQAHGTGPWRGDGC